MQGGGEALEGVEVADGLVGGAWQFWEVKAVGGEMVVEGGETAAWVARGEGWRGEVQCSVGRCCTGPGDSFCGKQQCSTRLDE